MRAEELIDEDDWVEVEKRVAPGKTLAEVSVRISVAVKGRQGGKAKARTYFAFRGAAAEWIKANGPRFRVAIGGSKANFIRIVSDVNRGRFESSPAANSMTLRMNLGVVTAWPAEVRDPTAAEWDVTLGYMRLKLPEDFAVGRSGAPVTAKAEPKVAMPSLLAATRAGPPQRSANVVEMSGDPAPGRSALGRR